MRRIRCIGWVFLLIGWCQLIVPTAVMACPTCKDGLHDDGTAAAYAASILFMMAMPFVILTGWVTTIVRLRAKVGMPLQQTGVRQLARQDSLFRD